MQGPTLTIFESEYTNIFGCYVSISWATATIGKTEYKNDPDAFIFIIGNHNILI